MEPCGLLKGICAAFVFFNYVYFILVILCAVFYFKYYYKDDIPDIESDLEVKEEELIDDLIQELIEIFTGVKRLKRELKDFDTFSEKLFYDFDQDKSGFIEENELEAILIKVGKMVSNEIPEHRLDDLVAEWIRKGDKSGDGKLDLEEF